LARVGESSKFDSMMRSNGLPRFNMTGPVGQAPGGKDLNFFSYLAAYHDSERGQRESGGGTKAGGGPKIQAGRTIACITFILYHAAATPLWTANRDTFEGWFGGQVERPTLSVWNLLEIFDVLWSGEVHDALAQLKISELGRLKIPGRRSLIASAKLDEGFTAFTAWIVSVFKRGMQEVPPRETDPWKLLVKYAFLGTVRTAAGEGKVVDLTSNNGRTVLHAIVNQELKQLDIDVTRMEPQDGRYKWLKDEYLSTALLRIATQTSNIATFARQELMRCLRAVFPTPTPSPAATGGVPRTKPRLQPQQQGERGRGTPKSASKDTGAGGICDGDRLGETKEVSGDGCGGDDNDVCQKLGTKMAQLIEGSSHGLVSQHFPVSEFKTAFEHEPFPPLMMSAFLDYLTTSPVSHRDDPRPVHRNDFGKLEGMLRAPFDANTAGTMFWFEERSTVLSDGIYYFVVVGQQPAGDDGPTVVLYHTLGQIEPPHSTFQYWRALLDRRDEFPDWTFLQVVGQELPVQRWDRGVAVARLLQLHLLQRATPSEIGNVVSLKRYRAYMWSALASRISAQHAPRYTAESTKYNVDPLELMWCYQGGKHRCLRGNGGDQNTSEAVASRVILATQQVPGREFIAETTVMMTPGTNISGGAAAATSCRRFEKAEEEAGFESVYVCVCWGGGGIF
jgi:hypothetical protein